MIRSMTGFGRADVVTDDVVLTVEARSVNHRHLEIAVRLPAALTSLELETRRLIQSRVERGRLDVAVQLARDSRQPAHTVRIDTALAERYLSGARALAGTLGLAPDVTLGWVLDRPGVVQVDDATPPDPTVVWPRLAEAVGKALDELVMRRSAEGAVLALALRGLLAELGIQVNAMSARAPVTAVRRAERLRERIRTLAGEVPLDEARIATEVAMWAQKTDVTEELTRLRAHLDEFALMLDKGGPVGRGLDFLTQELNREVNTVAAKADDLELSQAALAAKGLIEKIREQVQNLE
jgi:uncharacterized protein (TIGR00255 family)